MGRNGLSITGEHNGNPQHFATSEALLALPDLGWVESPLSHTDVVWGARGASSPYRPPAGTASDSANAVSVVPDGIRTYCRPSSMYVVAPAYKADPV
jgi:hypothetical protein